MKNGGGHRLATFERWQEVLGSVGHELTLLSIAYMTRACAKTSLLNEGWLILSPFAVGGGSGRGGVVSQEVV